MKILIADDDLVSRTLLLDILASAQSDYELLPVEDGQKAWEVLQANPDIALAIIDLAMPGLSGLDWLTRARADERFAALPVIVCTGATDRATVTAVAAQGVRNFLVKPFTRTTVLEKVWQICRPAPAAAAIFRDLTGSRQRLEIDRDTHRELLSHFVRVGDMWATDARRATDCPRIRALAVRAGNLKQMLTALGAVAAAARLQEVEEALSVYRAKPLAADMPGCIRKVQQCGEQVQAEIDRVREALDTIA